MKAYRSWVIVSLAALVIEPVLITMPYALERGLTNRVPRLVGRRTSP